jgi:hypothetical protein
MWRQVVSCVVMFRPSRLLALILVLVPAAAWPQGGTPLGPEFRINTYTTDTQTSSALAMGPSGDFVVVWSSYLQDGSHHGVFGQRYAASGTPLGGEFRVNTYTTNGQGGAAVAWSAPTGFVVVWSSDLQDGSQTGVFGQRYASSGVPVGPEFRVNTYTTNLQDRPAISGDSSGNFVVVWYSEGQDDSAAGVFGQRYAGSGVPLGPEFRVNTYTTGFQALPDVASDASGNFVVTWTSENEDGSVWGIFGQRFASTGTPLGPEFRVNTYTTQFQNGSSVAAASSGFVVLWMSYTQDASGNGVFGQRYASSGGPVGPEFRVNTYTTDHQQYPSVAADASGNFVMVWDSRTQDGSIIGVFGQRYASSGNPLGPEFRVNTNTIGFQKESAVAADPAGNFVVTWDGEFLDGSQAGIFGQRYSAMVPVELMRFVVE